MNTLSERGQGTLVIIIVIAIVAVVAMVGGSGLASLLHLFSAHPECAGIC